ncbi:hypothetical protein NMG60_11011984 [Bertholletia excelsa]
MARTQIMILFSLLSVAFHSNAAYEHIPTKAVERKVNIAVEGIVYCQKCEHFGSWSLDGAEPIAEAKVSVICKDHRNRVSYYKAFKTDANGYFYAQLEGFKMRHYLLDHPLTSCKVRLVSSPLKSCNLLSNVNYGLNGSPLRYENKRLLGENYEAVIYAAGPVAFRPSHCTPNNFP